MVAVQELKKNQTIEVRIEGYAGGGAGVARIDGRVVFVHGAMRGEVVRALVLKVNKSFAYAKATEILEQSAHRTTPDCPYYPRCGGCSFRHMEYAEEKQLKRERVQDALRRIGGSNVQVERIIGADSIFRYRNKSIWPVTPNGAVGFYRARTHDVINAEHCLLVHPAAEKAADALRGWMAQWGVPGYDEKTGKGLVRHLFVRSNTKGESLICVVANDDSLPFEGELVRALRGDCPRAVGVVLNTNTEDTNVVLGGHYRTLWGSDRIDDTLGELTFSISVPSFYQINHAQCEKLYAKAEEYAGLMGGETLLDLYCGAGTIGLSMAKHADRVIGAEIVPEAVEDARANALRNRIRNAEFLCGDASEVAARLAAEGLLPDVIIVDPPRKGLDEEVIRAIVTMEPLRVVYVSCDPATLARDVKRFSALGYEAMRACPVDMFPRADHVETVVLLSRNT
ncbi:MAG: 23S rRNA (uracil(1939)-C(5))-methyltransferase RlmD [Ruminococcaceae bacterium]|nr:23S rRNA (uracil(1939)-C(5))-methyltransferase RlmD [Oscillospiraceae bacterium]